LDRIQSIIQHAVWLAVIYQTTPWLSASSGMRKFGQFAIETAKRRIGTKAKRKDLFYHLVRSRTSITSSSL